MVTRPGKQNRKWSTNLILMTSISVIKGDITKVNTVAIVNAANSSLMGGGGVDGAIHRAGGSKILEACREIVKKQGGCRPGEAVITTGGSLPAKYVIHTVGPIWHGGKHKEDEVLANCYRNSLSLAVENNISSIAFPNISTGVYGFPKERAATIASTEVRNFVEINKDIDEILFVCFDDENYSLYKRLLDG